MDTMDTMVRVKWCKTKFVPGEASAQECADEGYDEIENIGYLIHRDAKKVVISPEKIGPDYCDFTVIPANCILDLSQLSVSSTSV